MIDNYQPTNIEIVKTIMLFADLKPNEIFIDLGSGDARLLVEAAKHGARAIGYEIDSELCRKCLPRIQGLNIEIINDDFLNADLSKADLIAAVVTLRTGELLLEKFKKEGKSKARLVLPWEYGDQMKKADLKVDPKHTYYTTLSLYAKP